MSPVFYVYTDTHKEQNSTIKDSVFNVECLPLNGVDNILHSRKHRMELWATNTF